MRLHILYDSRRFERFEPLMNELAQQGIADYVIWEPVHCPESVIKSINLSHKQIVRWAKEQGMAEIAIAEDDLQFTAIGAWQRFLDDIPPYPFDIYLGGTYGLDRPITGKTDKINGFHLYIVRKRFYDTFLGVPDDIHIDVAMDRLGIFYVEYPFIALQRPGFSSTSRELNSNKNADLFPEDIFKG